MYVRDADFDARLKLEAIGGDRLHPCYAPGASEEMMASLRLFRPEPHEYAAVHAIASDTIGGELATMEEIRRVDALTGAAIWVVRRKGEVTGFLAPLALTHEGRDALVDGAFNAASIREEWVAALGQPLAGFYCWSYAGRDQLSRGALVLGLRKLIDSHFADLPFFGRDTTAAGAKIMDHLGFPPFGATPNLFWRCYAVMGDGQ